MNKTPVKYRLAYVVALLFVVGCGTSPPRHAPKDAAVRLETADLGICSGTVIGPHAILTASHCLQDTALTRVNDANVDVKDRVDDGHDHTIVLVDVTFTYWATRGPEAEQGDRVHYWGNPDGSRDWYRQGYVVGKDRDEKGRTVQVFDVNGFFGDSGSGVFNEAGQLVAVTSLCEATAMNGLQFKMMASYPLHFTPEQWAKAGV